MFRGAPRAVYRLETSIDLVHWEALTEVVSADGIFAYMHDALTVTWRFYRLRWTP
jgi:hypothetical protein